MKTCPVCKREHQRQGIYCSRKCCRRVSNAKARGTSVRPPVASFACAQCGTRCVPGENVAAHASRFCGYDCKAAWHRPYPSPPRALVRVGYDRRRIAEWRSYCALRSIETALGSLSSKSSVTAYRRALRRDPCSYCGEPAEALDHIVARADSGPDGTSNRTAACHRCNSLKGTLTLLQALPWIPVATEYHEMRRVLHAAA